MKEATLEIKKSDIKINKFISKKYEGKVLFQDKYNWALEHFKGRDLIKEIEELKKEE
jgi:hypothetical protein